MQTNYIEFINKYDKSKQDKQVLLEAFQEKDVKKALEIIEKILKKHIDGLISLDGFVDTIIDGNNCVSKQYIVSNKKDYSKASFFQFNWLTSGNSVDVYSVDFFKNLNVYWDGKGKSDLSIYTLGSNISYYLPIIWTVVNSHKYELSQTDAEKLLTKPNKDVKESSFYIGNLKYTILEGLKKSVIKDAFILETKEKNIESEYNTVITNIKEDNNSNLKVGVKNGANVNIPLDKGLNKVNKEFKSKRKDPEQAFKEMEKYVSLIAKGLQPSLIICGAPGLGKTYRVKKKLKEYNYKEGENLGIIKGKCTTRRLYLLLYEFKNKNDIVFIDDADSLVGPKADENSINILKAALDSTTDPEGRLVTYGISTKLTDDDGNDIPKKFYYQGGVIINTNYRAGALDTALRGRSFMQDLDFTNKEALDLIKKLLPNIEPEILDVKSKFKSYEYLVELNEKGSDMELSLRTFVLCAKIFKACDGDDEFTDDDAKSMIEEQMRLQYARGISKY